MQPDSTQPPPDYNFILNEGQKKPSRLINLSRPVLIIGAVLGLMVVLIIFGTILGAKNKKSPGLVEVLGKAQEITRVNALPAPLNTPDAIALQTTVQSSFTSEQSQLKQYLSSHHQSASKGRLAAYQNKSIDNQLAQALSNNSLDQAYLSYLKQALGDYAESLKNSYARVSDPAAKAMLKAAYDSTQALLSAPSLRTKG